MDVTERFHGLEPTATHKIATTVDAMMGLCASRNSARMDAPRHTQLYSYTYSYDQ